jgi:hypothetical protein
MNLEKLEKLLKTETETDNYGRSAFLHRDGTLTFSNWHNEDCKALGFTLDDYLNAGGCRLKVIENQMIAIETGQKLTDEQVDTVCSFIRANSFGYLVYFQQDNCRQIEIEDFNRIKPHQFKNALVSDKKDIYVKNF